MRGGGEDGVAVALLLHGEGGVEVEMHAQALGDGVGLVDHAGARAADVHFLEGHDIRLTLGDHRRHPADVEPTVDADATMDVVGHDPGHGSGVKPRRRFEEGSLPRKTRAIRLFQALS